MKLPAFMHQEISLGTDKLPPTPLSVRLLITVSFSVIGLLGIGISFRQALSEKNLLYSCLFWIVLSTFCGGLVFFLYHTTNYFVSRHFAKLIENDFREKGFCIEMAENAHCIHVVSTENDLVLAMFYTAAAEHYSDLPLCAMRLRKKKLTQRQQAMQTVSNLHTLLMTGCKDAAKVLFAREADALDYVYTEHPDFGDWFLPYQDDALMYFRIAAGFCIQDGSSERAEKYRKAAIERIMLHPAKVQPFLERVLMLDADFAANNLDPANAAETAFGYDLQTTVPALSAGMQHNLSRMAGQSMLFGTYIQEKEGSKPDASWFERKLPPPMDAAPEAKPHP